MNSYTYLDKKLNNLKKISSEREYKRYHNYDFINYFNNYGKTLLQF